MKQASSARIIPVEPFDYLVFGGTGDLALRKLYPSLLQRDADGQLPVKARIFGAARHDSNRDSFIKQVKKHCQEYLGAQFPKAAWDLFAERLDYLRMDVTQPDDFARLKEALDQEPNAVRVYYLAMAPSLFGQTAANLHAVGLHENQARIVLEKPVGRDLETFQQIDDQVRAHFEENQIYRIDHYLGKETVQNLAALRFSNILFTHVWDADYIDHVQITVAETVGLGERAGYYDRYGAMRDMVQNHLVQLLCLVAMEPPSQLEQDMLRDEKLKVLRALRPWSNTIASDVVFGQYEKGSIGGKEVPGYLEELGEESRTETFVALRTYVDNWRWKGVPFYLRTGKRLASRHSEIVIQFKNVAHSVFDETITATQLQPNRLVLRLQPDEGVSLELMTKDPGPGGMRLREAKLDLSFQKEFNLHFPDAYERLLLDVVRGNSTLFMRRDEVEAAWHWIGPLLRYWENSSDKPRPYAAGSWGPLDSNYMIYKDNNRWHEES